jgi:hypothetical protein
MTAHETLKSFGIDVQRLHDEKPMLYTNIIRSMEEYAQQQVNSVYLDDVVKSDKHRVVRRGHFDEFDAPTDCNALG